ncbi:phosphate ABC transporter ATP-binding protein [Natronolimnobius sp. AArcel1]|uniref:phosphate ABC transporter ATP-binding protein PstB n=1 Tax=Natronolimnobius sp. AArcel1 TaxID=1679093 RepID=UPI0013EA253E|nr:phosphate ABC transporter ATP-binding protein PstB [Natronolimnobius sp. AArcel1]NGM69351.1 phosphate ABC transporter ATP-binding protein [Natronolimnobius sp. AArcel1]
MSKNTSSTPTTDESSDRTTETTDDAIIQTDISVDERSLSADDAETIVRAEQLNVYYDDDRALDDVTIEIPKNRVTAMIGPSGCGKSTFLRSINRMNDRIPAASVEGDLYFGEKNVYDDDVDPVAVRRTIGQVFQSPNPFPKSIYDNVAYGLRVQGKADEVDLDAAVERALRGAALWDEVNGQLDESGLDLSGGQQQRLCIARAIAPDPEVLLMDEPTSALDPVAASKIEDLIDELVEDYTVIIVTHNMQQAARISDQTAVFLTGGELVEFDETATIFENPADDRVEDYITGKFG